MSTEGEAPAGPHHEAPPAVAASSDSHQSDEKASTATVGEGNPTTLSKSEDVAERVPSTGAARHDDPRQRVPLDEKPKKKIAVIVGSLCLAVFLAALDISIVATALPSIAQDLHLSQNDYNWIGSAYILASAAATPAWGKISDIFGRKPIILTANGTFFIGSLICAVSVNGKMLVAGRALQGIGSGGLLSLSNICIGDLFSQRSRGVYYSFIGGVWAFAGGIGPLLGGVFAQYSTWRWCFYINLPVDGVALILLTLFLDIDTPRTPVVAGLKAIDWLGLLLSVGAVIMFLMGLEFGGIEFPWASPTVICLLVFGVATFGIFLVVEWKVAKYPMMPPRLFASRSNVFAFATNFCHGTSFIAANYYLPVYFQTVLGSSPFMSGVELLGFICALSVTSVSVGLIIRRTGDFKTPICLGMFTMTLGFGLLCYLPSYANWARIIPAQIVLGLGAGPIFQAPLIALQAHSRPSDLATLTGAFAFIRQTGGAVSIIIGGAILQNRISSYQTTLAQVLPPEVLGQISGTAAGANAAMIRALPEPARDVVRTVFTESLQTMWIFYTCIAGLGFLLSLMIRKKKLSKTHEVRRQGLEAEEEARQEYLAKRASKRASRHSGGDVEKQMSLSPIRLEATETKNPHDSSA